MAAHQAPPSLGFSRQEHWSGLPFPSPKYISIKPYLLRDLIMKWYYMYQMFFLHWWDDHMIFICYSVVTFVNFHMLNRFPLSGINPTWSWCMIILMCCWIPFASILLRIFASLFIRDTCWPAVYFFHIVSIPLIPSWRKIVYTVCLLSVLQNQASAESLLRAVLWIAQVCVISPNPVESGQFSVLCVCLWAICKGLGWGWHGLRSQGVSEAHRALGGSVSSCQGWRAECLQMISPIQFMGRSLTASISSLVRSVILWWVTSSDWGSPRLSRPLNYAYHFISALGLLGSIACGGQVEQSLTMFSLSPVGEMRAWRALCWCFGEEVAWTKWNYFSYHL